MKRFVNLLSGFNPSELKEFGWFLQHPKVPEIVKPKVLPSKLKDWTVLKITQSIVKKQPISEVCLVEHADLWELLGQKGRFAKGPFSALFTPLVKLVEAFLLRKYQQEEGKLQLNYALLRFSRERRIESELKAAVRKILKWEGKEESYLSLQDLDTCCNIWREMLNVQIRFPKISQALFDHVDCKAKVIGYERAYDSIRKESWRILHGISWEPDSNPQPRPNRLLDLFNESGKVLEIEHSEPTRQLAALVQLQSAFGQDDFPLESAEAFTLFSVLFRDLLKLNHRFPNLKEVRQQLIRCYEVGFAKGLLAQEGKIPAQHFVNFIGLACESGDIEAAKKVASNPPSNFGKAFEKEQIQEFGAAIILFHEKEYTKAKKHLLHYRPFGKRKLGYLVLELKIALELQDPDFSRIAENYRDWLASSLRNKLFSNTRIDKEKRKLSLLSSLFDAGLMPLRKKKLLAEKITNLGLEVEWMLKKLWEK